MEHRTDAAVIPRIGLTQAQSGDGVGLSNPRKPNLPRAGFALSFTIAKSASATSTIVGQPEEDDANGENAGPDLLQIVLIERIRGP